MEKLIDRFIRYVKIDTQSSSESKTFPSTEKQKTLLSLLCEELKAMGVKDASMDEHGYVMATIPSTTKKNVPVIGFIAHVDTSEDLCGTNVKPRVIECYEGGDIKLNDEVTMHTCNFPQLDNYIGQTLITTDGTTLLGADDKAGVAEIMTAAHYFMSHPEIEHGEIKIGFTPDEEIGRGVDFFDVKRFGADFAYTLDGGRLGELEYESFNAASADITIHGRNVHPGYAKNKMINSFHVAQEFNSLLPVGERPEYTSDREGFYHLVSINGSVDSAKMSYIIRDHSTEIFNRRKKIVENAAKYLNDKYGYPIIELNIRDQYYNMGEVIKNDMRVVDIAFEAMTNIGVTPQVRAIRGGTDGSRLSFMGLPCPNLFAGGENFHGRYEFASLQTMQKAVDTIIEIIALWSNK